MRSFSAGIGALCVAAACLPPAAAQRENPLVVRQVTVIDGTGAPARANQTVVISGNRITDLGSTERIPVPRDARVVDGSGKYLIPGLWDMHVHMRGSQLGNQDSFVQENEAMLPLYLANGVTGVREMGGDMVDTVLQWRDEISRGQRQGPRILTCGPKLDGPKPTWPGSIPISTVPEARSAVQHVKDLGADFVKVYDTAPNIPREAYLAILDEAKGQRLRVTGHLTRDILYSEASAAGQDFEHIGDMLSACSKREEELSKARFDSEGIQALVNGFDPQAAKALLAGFVRNGTWVTPTLDVRSKTLSDKATSTDYNEPRRMYLPERMMRTWTDRDRNPRWRERLEIPIAIRRSYYGRVQVLTQMMRDAGVPLLAGSDTGASNPNEYPGFSLHDELARMVGAGLTPMQALQTSTWNAAKWQGRLSSLGSIERGKLADLVLLDANPLDDIHNTTKIRAVIANGQLLDRARLDSMLSEAKRVDAKELVGTWKLVRCVDFPEGGEPVYLVGKQPIGQFIYTADGHLSIHIMQNPVETPRPATVSEPQPRNYIGYFGTYTVHPEEQVVVHHVVGGNIPAYINTDQRRPFKLEGDQLIIGGSYIREGKKWTYERVLVRQK